MSDATQFPKEVTLYCEIVTKYYPPLESLNGVKVIGVKTDPKVEYETLDMIGIEMAMLMHDGEQYLDQVERKLLYKYELVRESEIVNQKFEKLYILK